MNKIISFIILLISLNAFGQDLNQCGMDNNPKLTRSESEFLNEYMNEEQRNEVDFTDKKVIFVTGSSGHKLGTKSDYFKNIKKWDENGNKIATWAIKLNEKEKINSGGYDVIITYWVKLLTNRKKQKIINTAKASR